MKKAISLLTSMMVLSLVAANMAVPASAADNLTYDIEDLTVNLEDLSKTADGDYIVQLPINVSNSVNVSAISIFLSSELEVYTEGEDEDSKLFGVISNGDAYDNAFDIATTSKGIAYTDAKGFKEQDGVACYVSFVVPKTAADGDKFAVSFNTAEDNIVFDSNNELIDADLVDGYIQIGGAAEETTTSSTEAYDGPTLNYFIDNIEIQESELANLTKTADGNYIYELPINVNCALDSSNISALSLFLDTQLDIYTEGEDDESKLFGVISNGDAYDNAFDVSTSTKGIAYTDAKGFKESATGVVCYVSVVIPGSAAVGDKYDVGFSTTEEQVVFDADNNQIEKELLLTAGSISIVASEEEYTGPFLTYAVDELEIPESDLAGLAKTADGDYIVELPINVDCGLDSSNISALSLFLDTQLDIYTEGEDDESKLFGVIASGDAYDDAFDIATNTKGIAYTDAKGFKESATGVVCYVSVVVPSTAKAGDKFDVGFSTTEEQVVFDADNNQLTKELKLLPGFISITPAEETTTTTEETTTEETTTTTEETTTTTEETTTTTEETTTEEELPITETTTEETTTEETTTTTEETTTTTEETTTTTEETTTTTVETTTATQAPITETTTAQGGVETQPGQGGGDVVVSQSGGNADVSQNVDVSAEGGDANVSADVSAEGGNANVSADVSAGGGNADVSNAVDVSAEGGNADVSAGGGNADVSNAVDVSAEGGNADVSNNASGGEANVSIGDVGNPTINITVNGGGGVSTDAPAIDNPTGTTQAPAATTTTVATTTTKAATTTTTKAATTTAKSSDSPSTGSTGIGATIMAMIAAAASAFALKKKND